MAELFPLVRAATDAKQNRKTVSHETATALVTIDHGLLALRPPKPGAKPVSSWIQNDVFCCKGYTYFMCKRSVLDRVEGRSAVQSLEWLAT